MAIAAVGLNEYAFRHIAQAAKSESHGYHRAASRSLKARQVLAALRSASPGAGVLLKSDGQEDRRCVPSSSKRDSSDSARLGEPHIAQPARSRIPPILRCQVRPAQAARKWSGEPRRLSPAHGDGTGARPAELENSRLNEPRTAVAAYRLTIQSV